MLSSESHLPYDNIPLPNEITTSECPEELDIKQDIEMKEDVDTVLCEEKIIQPDTETKNVKKGVKRSLDLAEKNPISALNELRPGLKFQILEQNGPAHCPTFKICVEVDGQKCIGIGNSKKAAKSRAAETALRTFIQFPNNSVVSLDKKNTDFTADSFEPAVKKQKTTDGLTPSKAKGSVMMLNEMYPKVQYTSESNDADVYARFKVTALVNNEKFIGTGSNKKMARQAAASAALSKLLNLAPGVGNGTSKSLSCLVTYEEQRKADLIGSLVIDKFSSLMANDLAHSRRKVLAGIIKVENDDTSTAEVIAVTTGTKCVSGNNISMNGLAVNDCHAEILARRCLMHYFYTQLELLLDPATAQSSIFEPKTDGHGYALKSGLDFYLYINTAPCGDARVFSPSEVSFDRHPNRNSRGQLRTKIESGEGTIPVKAESSVQTWDGVIQGERLLTMSCSDKVCKWNILGLQGALLSHFIEPVYMKGLILGSLLNEPHLSRAICGRVEATLQGLPPPFRLNRPATFLMMSSEVRYPSKAPSFAVNWIIGSEVEIVNTVNGRPETGGGISRISKRSLMTKYLSLSKRLSRLADIESDQSLVYADVKKNVSNYAMAKESLYGAFQKAGLGTWVCKPIEQDMFEIFDQNDDNDMVDGETI